LPRAYALCREAGNGGVTSHAALTTSKSSAASRCSKAHSPKCKPGEGKNPYAPVALYLHFNCLGKGAHLATVQRLSVAKRDAEWMNATVFEMLGVTVGIIQTQRH